MATSGRLRRHCVQPVKRRWRAAVVAWPFLPSKPDFTWPKNALRSLESPTPPKRIIMSDMVDRRTLLKGAAASAAGLAAVVDFEAEAAEGLRFAEPVAFSFEGLKARARDMARTPYVGPARPAPQVVQKINYEEWGKITLPHGPCAVRRWPGPFSHRRSFISACSFRRPSTCMSSRAASRARSSTTSPISTCPPIPWRDNCRKARALPAFASRRRATAHLDWQQKRLGRVSRRGLFPLDRRTPPIRPVLARHRARCRGRRPSRRIPRLHQFLHRFERGRRQRHRSTR